MEGLPKDVLMETALNLSPPDLISFCATGSRQNEALCNSEIFWRRKLERDYPEEFLEFYKSGYPVENPKRKYINRFTYISGELESFIDDFIDMAFGSERFRGFLNNEYRKEVFKALYRLYEETENLDEDDDEAWNDLIITRTADLTPNLDVENWDDLSNFLKRDILHLHTMDKINMAKRKFALSLKKKK